MTRPRRPVRPRRLEGPNTWHRRRTKPLRTYYARCYRTKAQALHVFAHANQHVIGRWGGLEATGRGGEFDAVNERYGLRGRKRVRTIGAALWHALPPGAPYCLDRIDLDTLNETQPAIESGGFQFPDSVIEAKLIDEERRYYRNRFGRARRH